MAHICLPLLSLRQAQCARVVANCDDGHATSAAGLHDAVARLSSALTSGPVRVAPGDRVALLAHNSDLLFSTLLAVLDAGGIACPLNWRWSQAELAAALRLVQPVAVLADDECLAAAHAALQQLVGGSSSSSSRCTLVYMCRTDSSSSSSARGALASPTWSLPRLLAAAAPQQHQRQQPPALQLLQPQDGAALIVFTSGTTGASKGVVLSHASVVHQAAAKLAAVGYAAPDVYLHLAPLFHIGGLSSAFAVLMAGGAHVFLRRYSAAAAVALIRRHGVTALIAVPAMMQDMVDAAAAAAAPAAGVQDQQQQQQQQQLPSLRRVLVGAGGMQPALQRAVAALFPRAQLHTAYGMTEAGSSITFVGLPEQQALMAAAAAAQQQQQPGDAGVCVGRPGPGIAVSIDAAALQERQSLSGGGSSSSGKQQQQPGVVGEVLTRGPHVMQGYWAAAEATRQALLPGGWLRTGDLGRLDSSGNLWLVGRLKDMIKSGGENVFAAEVQAALLRHPGVNAAAVLGLPHARLGEQVVAVLVLARPWCAAAAAAVQGNKDGRDQQQLVLSLAALQEHCRACGLSPFKVPRVAAAVGQLPLNSSGKVMAAALRQQLMQCMQQGTGSSGGGQAGRGRLQLLQDTAGSSFLTSKL